MYRQGASGRAIALAALLAGLAPATSNIRVQRCIRMQTSLVSRRSKHWEAFFVRDFMLYSSALGLNQDGPEEDQQAAAGGKSCRAPPTTTHRHRRGHNVLAIFGRSRLAQAASEHAHDRTTRALRRKIVWMIAWSSLTGRQYSISVGSC